MQKRRQHPLLTMSLLILTFAGPIVGAKMLYAKRDSLKVHQKTNHGHLLQPSISLTTLTLYNKDGKKIDNQTHQYQLHLAPNATRTNGAWMLLLLYPKECDSNCEKGLYYLRQIRLATGKDRNRVERAILTTRRQKKVSLKQHIKNRFPGMRLLFTSSQGIQQVFSNLSDIPFSTTPGTLYLIDPFGNIVLAYPPNEKPTNVLIDLKKLLRISTIG